jgi:hypothetical protein
LFKELSLKLGKDDTRSPLFGHIGDKNSKNRNKKYTELGFKGA